MTRRSHLVHRRAGRRSHVRHWSHPGRGECSSYDGLAAQLEKLFTANGFDTGRASTAAALSNTSAVGYGDGVARAGKALAAQLNLPAAEKNDALPATTVQLTVGTDFPASEYVGDTAPAAPAAAAVSTVSATATGTASPAPTDLSHMTGESVPCVK